MNVARALLWLSAIALGVTGVAYIVVPAAALSIVGIEATATTEFLLRTQGVPLLACGLLLIAISTRGPGIVGIGLLVVAAYLLVSSVIDLAAFISGIVGLAAVPSALVRILVGVACLFVARRARRKAREAERAAAAATPAPEPKSTPSVPEA
jgi:hypothetical protein